jgi:hypothetical protein
MTISDISNAHMIWRSYVRAVKTCPTDHSLGIQACIAQMKLVTAQALYFHGFKS